MSLAPGEVFAGYTIGRRIGVGGMGEVYRVEHPRLDRNDALKVLTAGLEADVTYRARFRREATIAGSLTHPHIVPVYDFGAESTADGGERLWIAMAFIDGVDAQERSESEGALPVETVLEIAGQVAGALDFAHGRGLVHRDVKPANIMLTEDGSEVFALLTDFGIATDLHDPGGLTGENRILATLRYAAPECLYGAPASARSDEFSFALSVRQLLTGVVPGEAQPEVGPEVSDVFARALNVDPDARYGSCRDFARDLRRACERPLEPTVVVPVGGGSPDAGPAPTEQFTAPLAAPLAPRPATVTPARPRSRGLVIAAAGGTFALVTVAVLLMVLVVRGRSGEAASPQATPAQATVTTGDDFAELRAAHPAAVPDSFLRAFPVLFRGGTESATGAPAAPQCDGAPPLGGTGANTAVSCRYRDSDLTFQVQSFGSGASGGAVAQLDRIANQQGFCRLRWMSAAYGPTDGAYDRSLFLTFDDDVRHDLALRVAWPAERSPGRVCPADATGIDPVVHGWLVANSLV